ncbi:MAG: helix-turn-helix domain-containing protein [Rhodobacteraceae bacterium]|nr:helix-turn-helix domain-containing protein [Paracoccaceae bacterium]
MWHRRAVPATPAAPSGSQLREVLARARRRRAEALLRETTMPIAEIAYALGYEDHANFTHAFKRWTGRAPSAFARVNGTRASARHMRPLKAVRKETRTE